MDKKQEYLDYLQTSFRDYFANADKQSPTERAQAKSFINGLMVAGKIFGITSDELQQALSREQSHRVSGEAQLVLGSQEYLDIPAYIRSLKEPKSNAGK